MPADDITISVKKQEDEGETSLELVESAPQPEWPADADFAVVGTDQPRREGRDKVTGRAQYAADVRLPNQLYARVLRSPLPHARLRMIDTSAAEAMPGVHGVISAANAPDMDWFQDGKLFSPTLRYAGDEIAVVAAETEEIAADALRAIRFELEPLPHVTGIIEAVQPGAPLVHADKPGNIAAEPTMYERGSVEQGLHEADVVVEVSFITQAALHNALESHGCTASWDGDTLTLWDSTQSIFTVRQEVAEKLRLPEHKVRVIKQHMGGGFGAKQISWKPDVLASLLSQRTGRPVQLLLDRESENLASGNRNPTRQQVTIGAKRDGTLTVIDAKLKQAVGAYMTGGEASNVSGMYQTLYQCPNVRTEQTPIYTNTGPAVAFRAPGHAEAAFALEQVLDELARKLKLDPVELRRRNYAPTDQKSGLPLSLPDGLRYCYDKVTAAFGWSAYQRPAPAGPKRRGIGFAAHDWSAGSGHPPGYAWIELNSDGTADVVTGTQDIGTGTRTGLLQVAAEELGLPISDVSLRLGDTATGPYSPVSSGSATQATLGPAIRVAALGIKADLLKIAAVMMETDPGRLSVRDGKVLVDGDPARSLTVNEVMQQVAPHTLQAQGARGPNPEDVTIRTFGAQCIEVEVDTATGEVTVLRVATAHDVGRLINPKLVDSQVIGGVTQGIGYGLYEERIVDTNLGLVLNPNLEEYKVPTVADIPPITHARVDVPDLAANPIGAKGVGEPPLVPTAPAIANAVFDAIGVRIYEAPLTRHRVLAALAAAGGENS